MQLKLINLEMCSGKQLAASMATGDSVGGVADAPA
jgi:hypothetical protein